VCLRLLYANNNDLIISVNGIMPPSGGCFNPGTGIGVTRCMQEGRDTLTTANSNSLGDYYYTSISHMDVVHIDFVHT